MQHTSFTTFLGLIPIAIWLMFAWRAGHYVIVSVVLVVACGLLLRFGLSGLVRHVEWLYFFEHAGVNILLAWVFGRTLAIGKTPLCSRVAQIARGGKQLSPEVTAYTRKVTLAWTLFFICMASVSIATFLVAPISTWVLFATIATAPLVIAMFVIEYGIRRIVLPAEEGTSFLATIRAFRNMRLGGN